jgi:hypothetical protein
MARSNKGKGEAQASPEPQTEQQQAVLFTCERYPRLIVYGPNGRIGRFEGGRFETSDEAAIKALDSIPSVARA